jgi:hypothetical protein
MVVGACLAAGWVKSNATEPQAAAAPNVGVTAVPAAQPPEPAVKAAKLVEPRRALIVTGRRGLQPNALRGLDFIDRNFPQVTLVGGVRPDPLPWHPAGLALDVMVPNLAVGDEVFRVLSGNRQQLNISYILWRTPGHWDHLHVNFW